MRYLSRVADEMLRKRLEAFGAVLIEGPKWTGKTTTAEQRAKSVLKLQDPDKREEYLATATTMPSLLLKGESPRLIDEWQDAPMLWRLTLYYTLEMVAMRLSNVNLEVVRLKTEPHIF